MPTKKFKKAGVKGEHDECALLATGQQTVLPPSVHFTGRLYTWLIDHAPNEMDCAPAPKWLLELIKADKTDVKSSAANVPVGLDLMDEFMSEDFIDFLPADMTDIKEAEVKGQKKGNSTSTVDSIIYQVISAGGRDDAMTKLIGHFLSKPEYRNMPK